MAARASALDHVVLVVFENRSFDNLLGRLYHPGEVPSFEGVLGRQLTNPVPAWAEHRPAGDVVPYRVAQSMDSPDPDSGEEYQHTNTQLFNRLDPANRFRDATEMVAPFNAPDPDQAPTMDGFVTDYISFFTRLVGRQPTYDEYAQIMTGYTPEQVPVLSGLGSGVRRLRPLVLRGPLPDPGQPVVLDGGHLVGLRGQPAGDQLHAPQRGRDDLRAPRTARPDLEGVRARARPRLLHRPGPHVPAAGPVRHPFRALRRVRARGRCRARCPTSSLIEPNLLAGHGDYHPAFGRALLAGRRGAGRPAIVLLAGEAFLARIYRRRPDVGRVRWAPTSSTPPSWSAGTSPEAPTTMCPPGPCPRPTGRAPRASSGFRFDRSGYRVPAVMVSPWVERSVGVHRRVPAHLADRHLAGGLAAGPADDRPGRRRPQLPGPALPGGPPGPRGLARGGPPSRSRPSRWTRRRLASRSAPWAGTSTPAWSSTLGTSGWPCPSRRPAAPPRCPRRWPWPRWNGSGPGSSPGSRRPDRRPEPPGRPSPSPTPPREASPTPPGGRCGTRGPSGVTLPAVVPSSRPGGCRGGPGQVEPETGHEQKDRGKRGGPVRRGTWGRPAGSRR